ncbi:MAG TPA: phosphotransferase [Porticoccaceae bacterium]
MAQDVEITQSMLQEVVAPVPETMEGALDPQWLSRVLAHLSGGRPVSSVELADVVKAMAAKVRVALTFEGEPDKVYRLCIKGFLDFDLGADAGGITTLREADFYTRVAPCITMRTPPCAASVTDRAARRCVLIMSDMIAAGVHFYNALEPLTLDQVAETLDQLARLHAKSELLRQNDWIPSRIDELTNQPPHISWEKIQALMHDDRRCGLPDRSVDARLLQQGMNVLAQENKRLPHTILHGDCHPGNVYSTAEGRMGFTDWQLVHRGHWALDVSYHIASVLPVDVAEQEERHLLDHYLEARRRHGSEAEDREAAWLAYRRSPIYGFYHWAITQRVHPPITRQAFSRLGAAVTRHDTYSLLGL